MTSSNSDEKNSIPVSAGSLFHTPGNPFCYDETCGCHENPVLIAAVADAVNQGLLTPEEATRLVAGKTIWSAWTQPVTHLRKGLSHDAQTTNHRERLIIAHEQGFTPAHRGGSGTAQTLPA